MGFGIYFKMIPSEFRETHYYNMRGGELNV